MKRFRRKCLQFQTMRRDMNKVHLFCYAAPKGSVRAIQLLSTADRRQKVHFALLSSWLHQAERSYLAIDYDGKAGTKLVPVGQTRSQARIHGVELLDELAHGA